MATQRHTKFLAKLFASKKQTLSKTRCPASTLPCHPNCPFRLRPLTVTVLPLDCSPILDDSSQHANTLK
eukprot:3347865-Pleurochrysis_carterae.AAC.1